MTTNRKKALGDDPLFNPPKKTTEKEDETPISEDLNLSDIVTDEKIEAVKKTISDMRHEVKLLEKAKKNQEDDYQRMTFIVKKDLLDKLRDYCYTERISQKVGLERALSSFLEDKDDLVTHPERPKQVHKRK